MPIREWRHSYWTPPRGRTKVVDMTLSIPAPEVDEDDFREILAQTRAFVRNVVVPREQEIAETNAIPEDIRQAAKGMGLFGYAIPQEWGGLGLNLQQDAELAD